MRLGVLFSDFVSDCRGAVAPMYALALLGLITIAGVGWDYSRLMTMDTELQNAADQAALAAATQLDGLDGAMPRARAAANDFFATSTSAWVNETKLSNDGAGRPITGLTFQFFEDYDQVTDTPGTEIRNDNNSRRARFVRVIVNGREAFYALTAIGGTFSSGSIEADAVATLSTSICQAPRLFVCAPSRDFPTSADKGRGLVMRQLPNATDSFSPGNFGFLDPGGEIQAERSTGNPNRELARNSVIGACIASTGIESEPGFIATETNALNTRLDIYNPPGLPGCDSATGDFCPSQSTVSRMVYRIRLNGQAAQDPSGASCPATPPNNADFMSLDDALEDIGVTENDNPGYQRDDCLLNGSCTSLGDGEWSGQQYMNANHAGADLLSVSDGSRHGVYQWELGQASSRLGVRRVGYTQSTRGPPRSDLYCSYPQPVNEPAFVPSASDRDRRILTVASVDCTGLNGREPLDVLRFVDLFLVDASATTGPNSGEIMTEIVGPTRVPGANANGFQSLNVRQPVLVR